MGNEWTQTTLGDFCEFSYGKGLPERNRNQAGSIPVFGSNGIVGSHDEPYVNSPGIIIGRKGSIGIITYSSVPFWPIDTTFYVQDKPRRNLRFTYYLLQSLQLDKMNSDSAVPGLNRDAAHMLEIKVPPLATQERIADILGTLDDKIELNQQMNHTLEAMARAIFKSWFVDFDPVYAKMEGRDYPLPAEVMDLFPDELVESELGLIPRGWEVGIVKEKIGIHNGFAFKSEDYSEDGIFVFRTKNFTDANHVERLHDDVFLPDTFLESHKKFICQPFDSHVVMVGASVGKTSIIYPNCLPALRNQNMWCLRPNQNFPYRHYTNCLMADLIKSKLTWASGSARNFFRKSDFYNFAVIYPYAPALLVFEEFVSPLYEKIAINLEEIDTLTSTLDLMLPKLINRKIEV